MIAVTQWFTNQSTNTLNKGNIQAVETFKINNRIQNLVNSSFTLYSNILRDFNTPAISDSLTTLGYNSSILGDAIKTIGIPDSSNTINAVINLQVELSTKIIAAKKENNQPLKTNLIDSFKNLNISDKVYESSLKVQKLLESNLQTTLVTNSDEAAQLFTLNKYLAIMAILAIIILVTNIINKQEKQRKLIRSLQVAEAATQKSKQAKDEFLANMSHELRTPLNALIGFSNLLNSTPLNQKQKEFVDIISTNGDNLLNIVNDILDISKIEAGKLSFKLIPFDLIHLFKSLEKLFSKITSEKELIYTTIIDKSIPQFIKGDNNRLRQVLVNLIGNAIKFSNHGLVEITAKQTAINDKTCTISFSVKDSGPGIPKDKIASIFKRFEQLEHITTRQHGGTGLGLTIVKNIIEQMGGTINVESDFGKGAIFQFTLEFERANEFEYIQNHTVQKEVIDLTGKSILLVEDNLTNQKLISHLLMPTNALLTVANNGQHAINLLTTQIFDTILMDIQMPVMDGYTAIAIIRNELKLKTPILAMTAYVSEEEVEKVKIAGFNTHIAKPIIPSVLYSSIKETLLTSIEIRNDSKKEARNDDLDYFNMLFEQEEDARKEIIQAIQQQWQEDKKQLLKSLAENSCNTVKATFHSLKSTFSPFGQHSRAYTAIVEMENMALRNELSAETNEKCEQTIYFIDNFVDNLS